MSLVRRVERDVSEPALCWVQSRGCVGLDRVCGMRVSLERELVSTVCDPLRESRTDVGAKPRGKSCALCVCPERIKDG